MRNLIVSVLVAFVVSNMACAAPKQPVVKWTIATAGVSDTTLIELGATQAGSKAAKYVEISYAKADALTKSFGIKSRDLDRLAGQTLWGRTLEEAVAKVLAKK